ncbi:type VII secretion protein EccB, partial [Actinomycetospora atypica]
MRADAVGTGRGAPPTPAEVHARRTATRRLEGSLVGRDPLPERDPERTRRRALVAGAVLGGLAVGAAA